MIKIPFHKPSISNIEKRNINNILNSNWLTTGPESLKFEKNFKKILNNSKIRCVSVNSNTSGLHLLMKAFNIGHGDEVITSNLTYASTIFSIMQCGAKPIICDINLSNFGICLYNLKKKITSKTKAILYVHYAGYPFDITEIKKIIKNRKIFIFEDCAHSFPSTIGDKCIGARNCSDGAVYSFYANKTITTAEGGMIAVKNKKIYKKLFIMRSNGMDKSQYARSNLKLPFYDIKNFGYKYNLPDILAALGNGQLTKAEFFRSKREKISKIYFDQLKNNKKIILPLKPKFQNKHSWHLFTILLSKESKISRNIFILKLKKKGIQTSVHYVPIHKLSFFKKKLQLNYKDYPNSHLIFKRIVSLPLYPNLKSKDIKYITNQINIILK